MKTHAVKEAEIQRQWVVIDATGETLGRLASRIAQILKGKHKPIVSPHLDVGDYVVVVNAEKVRVTGKKLEEKIYYRHSGYPGGLKSVTLRETLKSHPTRVIEHAVKGMLPHNALGKAMLSKLKVYAGPTHPHEAQIRGQIAKGQAKLEEKE
ncbi:MAG: 50S ribosomal protein L13 [Chloroflexi bacterium]|nr:50S ribosomal protein L13 [Chloroflexota bacterium]MDA8188542.1 50S ribosomal protein L13 [Dehalococcoidales bacterium]